MNKKCGSCGSTKNIKPYMWQGEKEIGWSCETPCTPPSKEFLEMEAQFARQAKREAKMTLQKDDVWGKYDEKASKKISDGMIVARSGQKCPIFKDEVPYKSVTVICTVKQEGEVAYWLSYVHGGGYSRIKQLKDGTIAIRSDYQCW